MEAIRSRIRRGIEKICWYGYHVVIVTTKKSKKCRVQVSEDKTGSNKMRDELFMEPKMEPRKRARWMKFGKKIQCESITKM